MKQDKMSNKIINLTNQTHLVITKQNLVSPTQFILITISGGQDSLCLFFILLHLKKQWKWQFGILYCNHFWQIDSFYTNSLVLKLGFLFLIPAYLSLPSENIFSEQKSRTWRYRQFERLSNFYQYDILVTGHTSTDRIETILLQLIRGTSTRGLSTLDWIRPISQETLSVFSLPSEVISKVPFYLCPLKHSGKAFHILKNKNFSLSDKFHQIEFCNQFFFNSQINFWKVSFLNELNKKSFTLLKKQTLSQNLSRNLKLPLPLSKPLCLSPKEQVNQTKFYYLKQKVLKYSLDTNWENLNQLSKVQNKILNPFLYPKKDTGYGRSIRRNAIGLQRNCQSSSYQNTNWIYDNFLFLTLEKTVLGTPLYKVTYSFTKISVFRYLFSTLESVFTTHPSLFKSLNSLSVNKGSFKQKFKLRIAVFCPHLNVLKKNSARSLHYNSKLKISSVYSKNFSTNFIRHTLFSISRRITFRIHRVPLQGGLVAKIKLFFSKTSKQRFKSNGTPKVKYFSVRREDKDSGFVFTSLILNKQPSQILIKYFNKSYFIHFKKNFLELELFAIKNILQLELTPSLTQSYSFLANYQQETILKILYPLASLMPIFRVDFIFCNQARATKFIFSKLVSTKSNKHLKYIEHLNSLFNADSFHTYTKGKKLVDWFEKQSYSVSESTNLAFFLNTNSKFKFSFPLSTKDNLRRVIQRKNLGESSCFEQETMAKHNIFKKAQNKTKSNKTLNLVVDLNWKRSINCQQSYLKYRIKNSFYRTCLLFNSYTSQISNQTISPFTQIQNNYIGEVNKNLAFIIPNTTKFGRPRGNNQQRFVIRPLLFISRFDLTKVCTFWQLPVYPDKTNKKLIYFRNRIRKQLLPLLRFFFNPQIDKLFLQFTEITNTEQLYLDFLARDLQEVFQINKINTFELNLSVLNFIPIALQRRVLKNFIDQYFIKQIKFFHIQILLNLLDKKKKNQFQFYKKVSVIDNLFNQENPKILYQILPDLQAREGLVFISKKEKKILSIFHFNQHLVKTFIHSKYFIKDIYKKIRHREILSTIYCVKQSKVLNFISTVSLRLTSEIKGDILSSYLLNNDKRFSLYPTVFLVRSPLLKVVSCLPLTNKGYQITWVYQRSNSEKKELLNNAIDKKNFKISLNLEHNTLIQLIFFKHFLFMKQEKKKKFKIRQKLVNLEKKLKVRNIFTSKNKFETPQILFFSGIGACLLTSRRFILLSNVVI